MHLPHCSLIITFEYSRRTYRQSDVYWRDREVSSREDWFSTNVNLSRYSTFLVLYPVGITGELLCMYYSLDEVAEKQLLTYSMPNAWNVVFNYHYFLIFYMMLYIPLFPVLFGHMLAQRKKMLGRDAKKAV